MVRFFRSCFSATGKPKDTGSSTRRVVNAENDSLSVVAKIASEADTILCREIAAKHVQMSAEFMSYEQKSIIPKAVYCLLSPEYKANTQFGPIFTDVREKVICLLSEVRKIKNK